MHIKLKAAIKFTAGMGLIGIAMCGIYAINHDLISPMLMEALAMCCFLFVILDGFVLAMKGLPKQKSKIRRC